MSRWLIAYDIACPRRLRRTARMLEKKAVRCQKSLFLLQAGRRAVTELLMQLNRHLNTEEDVLQAWRLDDGQPREGLCCGTPNVVEPVSVIAAPTRTLLLKEQKCRRRKQR